MWIECNLDGAPLVNLAKYESIEVNSNGKTWWVEASRTIDGQTDEHGFPAQETKELAFCGAGKTGEQKAWEVRDSIARQLHARHCLITTDGNPPYEGAKEL